MEDGHVVCLLLWLLFRDGKGSQTEILSSDHYTQPPKSAAFFSNLMKAILASVLNIKAKQFKAKTSCSVSKRQCGVGSQGPGEGGQCSKA